MLTLLPRRRMATRVPSTSSFRRSTLCWCQRRLRPSVLTAPGGVCCATIALVRSLDQLDTTAEGRREPRWHGRISGVVADDGGVAHRTDAPGRGPAGLPAPPERLSFAESLASADSAADAERRRGLRRMKVVA